MGSEARLLSVRVMANALKRAITLFFGSVVAGTRVIAMVGVLRMCITGGKFGYPPAAAAAT